MKKKSIPAKQIRPAEQTGSLFIYEFFNDPAVQRIFYAVVPFLLFFVIIFSVILFSDRQFCFRDCHLFYYPLFEQIQRELNQGNLPFWNPCDNLGEPLLAVPTSSVFYPLKLIFFLTIPFPASFGILYKIYILIHYPLAYWGIYRLARFWNRSIAGASLAAIAFTFSCLFFFQYSNLIYLIGGAWLPWAIYAGLRLIGDQNPVFSLAALRKTSILAIFLALMILGGDLQTPYIAGLMLVWFAFHFRRQNKDLSNHSITQTKQNSYSKQDILSGTTIKKTGKFKYFLFLVIRSDCCKNIFRLSLAGFLLVLLTLIVLWPGQKYSVQTEREILTAPISIWQIPRFLKNNSGDDKNLECNTTFSDQIS